MKKNRAVKKGGKKIIRMKGKQKRGAAKAGLISLLVIVAALVLMLTSWFNIKSITVKGNDYIEGESIIAASKITAGENIFKINIKKTKDFVREIAYIDEVKIYRRLPSTVVISVTERVETAYIKCSDGYLLIDKDGRALEFTDITWGIPEITGIEAENFKEGQFVFGENNGIAEVISNFMDKLEEYDLLSRTTSIDVADPENIAFILDENKKIVTGGNFRVDYKLMMLKAVAEELAPSESGTVDLSVEGEALFSPEEEEKTE